MREKCGGILGPLLAVLVWMLPLEISAPAQSMAGVLVWIVCWWITEPIPLAATSLLAAVLPVVLGVTDPKSAFAPFAHPLIFLFLGGFLLARALRVHGTDRRIALFLLSRRWVAGDPLRAVVALWATTALFSFWLSNTATTAMMLPIALGVFHSVFPTNAAGRERGLITLAYVASIGGLATPVGSPPNGIAIGMLKELAGIEISFVDWMTFGVPAALGCFAVAVALGLVSVDGGRKRGDRQATLEALRDLGPLSAGERHSLLALGLAVVFWVGPGVYALIVGKADPLYQWWSARFSDAVVAMLAALLLFVLRSKQSPTLTWRQAVEIDWGALILFGGGLTLGSLLFETGLAAGLGSWLLALAGGNAFGFLIITVYFAIFFTEATSNTASANLLVPLVIAVCGEAGHSPLLPVMAVSMACSLAFMLPVATPPNAIVYGSGEVRLPQMLRMGFVLNIACGAVLLLVVGGVAWLRS